jgi:hypothetical protein
LKITLFDEEVIDADFMISQILSIFSPIGISPNNSSKTFVNSMGQEASEIDYFLHNIKEGEYLKKTVLQNLPEITSMVFHYLSKFYILILSLR